VSDSALVPRGPETLSLAQARKRLDESQYIDWLIESDASDARCYLELARYFTRRHQKIEMIAGAIIGFVSGLVLGGGNWIGGLLVGLAAFIATLFLIFLIHWIRAPSAFYKRALAERDATKLLLEAEKERNKRARLVGRIVCLSIETHSNTWHEIFSGEYPKDCIMTLHLSVTNDTDVAATAIRVELSLIWNETVYPCAEMPIIRGFLKRVTRRPGGSPRRVEWEPFKPFPLNIEITNTTHQEGWLKFWVGPIQDLRIDDTTGLRLVVFDHRNEPHTIYEGPVNPIPACGEIKEGLTEAPKPDWE
jgi:hypothetical protein